MALPLLPRSKPLPIIHLNGFPGTGKLTIAREVVTILQEHFASFGTGEKVKLVHNHLMINPADAVLHRTQPGYQKLRKALRDAIFSTLKSEPATFTTAYLFTDWQSGDDIGIQVCKDFQSTAIERGCEFIPIIVHCEQAENIARLGNSDRVLWHKVTDPELLIRFREELHPPPVHLFEDVDTRLELDVTKLTRAMFREIRNHDDVYSSYCIGKDKASRVCIDRIKWCSEPFEDPHMQLLFHFVSCPHQLLLIEFIEKRQYSNVGKGLATGGVVKGPQSPKDELHCNEEHLLTFGTLMISPSAERRYMSRTQVYDWGSRVQLRQA